MSASFERGEVYWFDFRGSTGSERDDICPAIVLSWRNETPTPRRARVDDRGP